MAVSLRGVGWLVGLDLLPGRLNERSPSPWLPGSTAVWAKVYTLPESFLREEGEGPGRGRCCPRHLPVRFCALSVASKLNCLSVCCPGLLFSVKYTEQIALQCFKL